ncbi:response regulator transcription factor [uncultured Parasutterella sp.]|uniref:response regulator transcription factor n=1 Tax=uncultured Parasutterella sp. TaxID=1263098 RepID=UPI00272D6888|nr:response regulator [uncultured Parasutterella sp.]
MKTSKLDPIIRIVDDDPKVLASEVFLVKMAGYRTASYGSALAFLNEYDPLFPGCLILDIRMPEMSGLQLQEEMIRRNIDLPVLFLTGHGDVDMAVKALLTGASDFLIKPPDPARLKASLAKAVAENLEDRARKEEIDHMTVKYNLLTASEKKVAPRIANGELNKVIAFDMEVSEQAVKNWRSAVLHKLECRNVIELHNFLRKIGIIEAS